MQAQVTTTILEQSFDLGSSFGDKDVHAIEVEVPGQIDIEVDWTGDATELALILNGPGQIGYYNRRDGAGPLRISFNVTSALISKGSTWTISICNFSGSGFARGMLKVRYPLKLRRLDITLPVLSHERPKVHGSSPSSTTATAPQISSSQGGKVQRSISDNGTVEIRYPDGTIRRVYSCGSSITRPDGTFIPAPKCLQVQPTTPPFLPADNSIIEWLDRQADRLLLMIKMLLDFDQASIDNFLNKEGNFTMNIYEKINLRSSYIDRLLSTL